MFFESDLRTAAEGAAFEMECHGLTAEQTDELAGVIECAIRDFFKDNDS